MWPSCPLALPSWVALYPVELLRRHGAFFFRMEPVLAIMESRGGGVGGTRTVCIGKVRARRRKEGLTFNRLDQGVKGT